MLVSHVILVSDSEVSADALSCQTQEDESPVLLIVVFN